jgi:hypothetical protein
VAGPTLRYLGIPPADVPSVPLVRAAVEPAPVSAPLTASEGTEAVMPDLVGRSLRQALTLLAGYDVEVSVAGRGVVVRQTPAPGAALAPGAFCRLELAPPVAAAHGRS